MATVSRLVQASCDSVWEVLADGWVYPTWVVGASRMRAVDAAWPAVGARLHHSVGAWPMLIDDTTEVREAEPPSRLLLRARGWPVGEARIELRLDPEAGGCRVTMYEEPAAGPGLRLFNPLADRMLVARNTESLTRLAALAEARPARR
jgi:uncharacterized protein YndB with AHSA1/START domain